MKRYVRLQIAFPLRIRANIIVIVDLFVSNDIKKQIVFHPFLSSHLLTNISYIYRACCIKPGKIKYFKRMVFQIQRWLSTDTTIRVYTIQFKETILFRDEITVSICRTKNLSRVVKKSIEKNIVLISFGEKIARPFCRKLFSVGKLKEKRENEKKERKKMHSIFKVERTKF